MKAHFENESIESAFREWKHIFKMKAHFENSPNLRKVMKQKDAISILTLLQCSIAWYLFLHKVSSSFRKIDWFLGNTCSTTMAWISFMECPVSSFIFKFRFTFFQNSVQVWESSDHHRIQILLTVLLLFLKSGGWVGSHMH